jgi:ligand-binding sensor domain-containing protein
MMVIHLLIILQPRGFLPTASVGLLEDSRGYLWFGARGGLTRFDGHSFQDYTVVFGITSDVEVISILEDDEQNLWFATNKGLLKYDGHYISHFTIEGGLSSNKLAKITTDRNGHLWIATQDRGAIYV